MSDAKYEAIYREAVLNREARLAEARAELAATISEVEKAFATELSEKIVAEMVKGREAVPHV